jgi:hypothetical protein
MRDGSTAPMRGLCKTAAPACLRANPRHPIGGRGGRLITIETSRGKVHRGSSSINMMAYSQTHRLNCGLDCAETRDLDIAIKAKRQVADAAARAEAKGV